MPYVSVLAPALQLSAWTSISGNCSSEFTASLVVFYELMESVLLNIVCAVIAVSMLYSFNLVKLLVTCVTQLMSAF